MNQQHFLQFFLLILIMLPVLYLRLRRMSRAQPLKLKQLWIRPALVVTAAVLAVFAPTLRSDDMHHFMVLDWAWLGVAGAIGSVAGWYWGRTMAIEVHPQNGTLMVTGSQAAIGILAVLIMMRVGLRTGLAAQSRAWHLDALLISDASIVFTAALFTLRSVEMYIRARRVMGTATGATQP
jgi:Protein of unknown function (DUF1453)